ncbi:hypothetical protein [Nioella aestuarii]|uniref:hypothetical protein n=1 Tax=Nioella aestuarii TaxID=1662864 RepID=UPI003D7F9850
MRGADSNGHFTSIDDNTMQAIIDDYAWCSSWAVWMEEGEKPKSNIGDLSIFDFKKYPEIRKLLHADYIAVGLNISSDSESSKFGNFHSSSPSAQDYKLRYAFQGTPIWGCYLTDILKDFQEPSSAKVKKYIKEHPNKLQPHFDHFKEEVRLLGAENSLFLGMGGLATRLLRQALPRDAKVIQIRHYSDFIGREKYRKEVLDALRLIGISVDA